MDPLQTLLGLISPSAAATVAQGQEAVADAASAIKSAKLWATVALVALGLNLALTVAIFRRR